MEVMPKKLPRVAPKKIVCTAFCPTTQSTHHEASWRPQAAKNSGHSRFPPSRTQANTSQVDPPPAQLHCPPRAAHGLPQPPVTARGRAAAWNRPWPSVAARGGEPSGRYLGHSFPKPCGRFGCLWFGRMTSARPAVAMGSARRLAPPPANKQWSN